MVSDTRKRVAERWSRVDYRSGAIEPAVKKPKSEVIDLTGSDSDNSDNGDQEEQGPPVKPNYPFKLVKSQIFDKNLKNSHHLIDLRDVLHDPSLRKSFLFSFQYELDFLLEQFHPNVQKIVLVAQEGTVLPPTTPKALSWVGKTHLCEFRMPPFTCHHSKLIINVYQDGSLQLFMPSNNFTYAETNYPQQVCWVSPRLSACASPASSSFQSDLLNYLKSYDLREINRYIIPEVEKFNFEPLEGTEFVYSTPSKDYLSGFQLLAQKLRYKKENGDTSIKHHLSHYLCQSSSVGNSLSRKEPCNLLTHMIIPVLEGIIPKDSKKLPSTSQLLEDYRSHHIVPYLLYPTVQEIVDSPVGWLCSGWFNFNYNKDMAHYNMLRDEFNIFHKQKKSQLSPQRRATPSHSKFYMKSTTRNPNEKPFRELDWCLFTSANLSFSAWGKTSAKPRNYEVGILLKSPDLRCQSFVDLIYNTKLQNDSENTNGTTVAVPWTPDLEPYEKIDETFCISKDYSQLSSS
ncbi:hypothetical protein ZYGR_0P00770 [Zygosaccharomyces rouxii]|uniref:ZYRO0E01914p n=2 Tax=Zygosaccharomyces rouxii TaxID=4956 RepID=C5E414_ZYGRC|nr:uncharacterized protein ZYRO0E01914g [Zygosaccharomyces rouxii]KAH9198365.1 tyrosyl-DNA phosphodiesterase I [Zygosaccharomyces rouxii]GAV49434.1 hypothetical protein ZYGR_0P00770 [Zygosaccharomyces rouxii]CAR30775.1 ZYRO0E01914p [Zygosaccharomyces rouxii]